MRAIILLILISFISCKTSNPQNKHFVATEKKLKTLLKNNVNDENFISFSQANLEILKRNDSLEIYKKETLIFKVSQKYSKLYQIFNDNFLIISISKDNSMSGIDNFSRDSTYVIDLNKKFKGFISLKNIILESDKVALTKYYSNHPINSENLHLAIDDINVEKNELYLLQPDLSVKKYNLSSITN